MRLIVLLLRVKARDSAFAAITYLAVFLDFRGHLDRIFVPVPVVPVIF